MRFRELQETLRQTERNYWLALIAELPTRSAVAKAAGVNRTYMYQRYRALGIPCRPPEYLGNDAFRSLSDEARA